MSNPIGERLATEITTLDSKIKKMRETIKTLMTKKREKEVRLANLMNKSGIEKVGEVSLQKIKPKPKMKRSTLAEKKERLQTILQSKGVYDVDTEELWDRLNSR